ncbi:MAG: hypothetical protein ACRDP3_14205 [Streptomyces sp.]|uniref:hypothetical protein n=1 Tax=Streptomyces sp. TaxID=1931 RepID=UPI003D6AB85D
MSRGVLEAGVALHYRTLVADFGKRNGGALADTEPLRSAPAPFPAMPDIERAVKDQPWVAFRANLSSVPPVDGRPCWPGCSSSRRLRLQRVRCRAADARIMLLRPPFERKKPP